MQSLRKDLRQFSVARPTPLQAERAPGNVLRSYSSNALTLYYNVSVDCENMKMKNSSTRRRIPELRWQITRRGLSSL